MANFKIEITYWPIEMYGHQLGSSVRIKLTSVKLVYSKLSFLFAVIIVAPLHWQSIFHMCYVTIDGRRFFAKLAT